MSKVSLKIEDFSGGIADDLRESRGSRFAITKHFDIFSNPKRLTPYRSLEADTNDGSSATGMKQYYVRDFVYASASAKLYGLGQNASGYPKVVYKADATTGNWTVPNSSEGNAAVQNGCFVEYKDYLWGFQGTNKIFKWGTLSGSPSITNSVATVGSTITSVAQGLIAKDDNLYLPYNNKLVRVNGSLTVQDAVLTLPTNFKITSIANYGNYLAIACAPVSTYNGVSKVFLWNLTSNDVQEAIDWGEGELRVLDTVEGTLIGVTDRYLNNATGAGRGSIVIQTYSSGYPQIVKEVFTQALSGKTMPLSKAVSKGRLFFSAKIMTNSAGTTYHEGIWSFGRKGVGYSYALTLDVIDENVNTNGIQAFGTAANYFFIAHSSDGSIDKTDDTAAYSFTSIYESRILNFDNTFSDKAIDFARISFRPLLSGETVTLKYKVDGDTTWTTIGSYSTVGAVSRTFMNIETTGAALKSGREFQVRLESTGGAEITGIELEATVLANP